MTKLREAVQLARDTKDANHLIDAIPYAKLLEISALQTDDEYIFQLTPSSKIVGNPTLPAIHGGAIGSFMEISAVLHLLMTMETVKLPKIIDFSLDYIRAATLVNSYASCTVVRQGSKLANVAISAWQEDRNRPTSIARAHFLLE